MGGSVFVCLAVAVVQAVRCVSGSRITGSGITGSGVTGSGVTGSGVTGAERRSGFFRRRFSGLWFLISDWQFSRSAAAET